MPCQSDFDTAILTNTDKMAVFYHLLKIACGLKIGAKRLEDCLRLEDRAEPLKIACGCSNRTSGAVLIAFGCSNRTCGAVLIAFGCSNRFRLEVLRVSVTNDLQVQRSETIFE